MEILNVFEHTRFDLNGEALLWSGREASALQDSSVEFCGSPAPRDTGILEKSSKHYEHKPIGVQEDRVEHGK